MKKTILTTGAAALLLGLAMTSADAMVITHFSNPTNVPIIDDAYDGTLASMSSSAVLVPGGLGSVALVEVSIGMDHDYVGDLVIKLGSPTGTLVTLLHRPGIIVPDDGTQCCGDASDFRAAFPITYRDSSPNDAEWMGFPIDGVKAIGDPAHGTPDHYFPNPGSATPGNLSTFIGEAAAGAWTLYIGDGASGDLGQLDQWELWLTTSTTSTPPPPTGVAEPGTLALFGLGLFGLGVVGRKRPA